MNEPIASHPHALGLGNGLSVVCAVVSGLGGKGTVYICPGRQAREASRGARKAAIASIKLVAGA